MLSEHHATEQTLEVQMAIKSFGLPGISKESQGKVSMVKRDKLEEEDLETAYEKLAEFKKKKGLNVLYSMNQPRHEKIAVNDLNNMDSYEKVQKLIFSQRERNNVEKANQRNNQQQRDEQNAINAQIYWAELLVDSDLYHFGYILCVALQQIFIVLKTIPGLYSNTLPLDIVFLILFSSEIVVKLSCSPIKFWNGYWNCLGFIIWVAELISICIGSDKGNIFSTLRIAVFLIPFKSRKRAHYLAGVRSIVSTISESIKDVGRIALLVIGLSFFWASIGTVLFGESVPLDFATIMDAYFTLFVSLTQIGWIDDFDELAKTGFFTEALIFYITYFFLIVHVLFKTIVAVVVSNLEEFHRKLSIEKRKRMRKLRSVKAAFAGTLERGVMPMPDKFNDLWKKQIALEVPDFSMISKDKLEGYFAVISIMEANLAEYSKLVEDLINIHGDVATLNNAIALEKQQKLEEAGMVEEEKAEHAHAPELGDALSRLLQAGRRKSLARMPSVKAFSQR